MCQVGGGVATWDAGSPEPEQGSAGAAGPQPPTVVCSDLNDASSLLPRLELLSPLAVTHREAGSRFRLRVTPSRLQHNSEGPEVHCRSGGQHPPFSLDWTKEGVAAAPGGRPAVAYAVEVWVPQAAREPGLYEFEAAAGESGG